MRIKVTEHLGDLEADLSSIPERLVAEGNRAVRDTAKDGQRLARGFARKSAGAHGVHYPNSITTEQRGALTYEYGPDPAMPQGGMSFEYGSRNSPPHLDLARSADIIGPQLADAVDDVVDRLFW